VATKTLVIDGTDPEHFFFGVEGSTLRVGADASRPDGGLRGLRVVRVRCEVVVEDDRDVIAVEWGAPEALGAPPRQREVRNGSAVQIGKVLVAVVPDPLTSLRPGPPAPPPPVELPEPPAAPPTEPVPAANTRKRFRVVDGGDQGQLFHLPESGRVVIGKADGNAEIVLNDLYVNRVHCSVAIDGGGVTVTHVQGDSGTRINGRRIEHPERLSVGGVLRVGNSHLKLEEYEQAEDTKVAKTGDTTTELPAMPRPPAAPPSGRIRAVVVPDEPQTLGHYRVGPLLGRGFSGVVHQATDTKSAQVVALKVFPAQFPASQAESDTFGRAIREAMPVRHPNLVALLGAGRSGPHCWIAREFIEGESTDAAIGRVAGGEKPSWTRAARVAVHLARVLDELHRLRLVHGNITPQNVLIRKADHATVLTDLRLSQALNGSKLQRGYAEKKLAAELPYLAPELADPGAFVDELADLYSVGAIAYALIAGRPPFSGKSTEERAREGREARPARPSSYYKKVPAAFDGVVLKLLAYRQEDRYPTATALLRDLAPVVQEHDIKL
jgi:pSer/pThr/pTyr-binding forkhead associated (FHA) protein